MTTFITPFGRFQYLCAPYSISSISEHYNRRITEAFKGLSGFRCVVDDFVIYNGNIEDHIAHVKQFVQRCAEKHIALNIEKCRFFQTKTTFAGFLLSEEGYQIDPPIQRPFQNTRFQPAVQNCGPLLAWSISYPQSVILKHQCNHHTIGSVPTFIKH